MMTDTIVSGISSTIILTNVETSVMHELITCGILWLISCLNVSISLVYTDIISPCACVSKYLIGSDSMLVKSSNLSFFKVPCPTFTMILLYIYEHNTPTRSTAESFIIAAASGA